MSHMNESCHISTTAKRIRMLTFYEWVMSRMTTSRYVRMSHVTYEWVMLHINYSKANSDAAANVDFISRLKDLAESDARAALLDRYIHTHTLYLSLSVSLSLSLSLSLPLFFSLAAQSLGWIWRACCLAGWLHTNTHTLFLSLSLSLCLSLGFIFLSLSLSLSLSQYSLSLSLSHTLGSKTWLNLTRVLPCWMVTHKHTLSLSISLSLSVSL